MKIILLKIIIVFLIIICTAEEPVVYEQTGENESITIGTESSTALLFPSSIEKF